MPIRSVRIDAAQSSVDIEYNWVGIDRNSRNRPLLVFLHEGLGSVSMWRDFPEKLCIAGNFRGLVYSRPGYGQSTPRRPDEKWRPDFMHQQARALLPALLESCSINPERDPVFLFGHSDGSSISLLHAAINPKIRGSIVLAPHLFVEAISLSSIEQARDAFETTDLRQKLARHHADPDSAFFGWNDIWLSPDFRDWNIESEVAKIQCPILAIQGEDDEYGSMDQIDAIARHVDATRLLKLKACGHSPHRDQTEKVIAAVVEFVDSLVTA